MAGMRGLWMQMAASTGRLRVNKRTELWKRSRAIHSSSFWLQRSSTADATDVDDEQIISALVVNRPGTLAQIADVFGYAQQNISGLSVRSTVVPELSRVTITCRLRESDVAAVQKRLRALVCVTFFHITTLRSCIDNNELLLRSHALVHVSLASHQSVASLQRVLEDFDVEIVFGDDNAVIPEDGLHMAEAEEQLHVEALHATASKPSRKTRTLFLHLTAEPSQIDAFVAALKHQEYHIDELQMCGPLFLDMAQSTLDTAMETSFSRSVVQEVERFLDDHEVEDDVRTTHRRSVPPKYKIEGLDDMEDEDEVLMRRPPTTFQLHCNANGHFTTERLQLHARIAHQLYESTPQNIVTPKFVLLIGVPGAGKSTILSHLDTTQQLKISDFVNFDVDDIIALLPEFYHAMLNIGLGNTSPVSTNATRKMTRLPGPQQRYQMCRDEARFILKKNLHSAIMCRRNIILHGTGKSFSHYANLIDQVKAAGFDAHVVCLDVPLELAYDRVDKRSAGYGRDVPRLLIDFTASLITRNFRRLAGRVPNAHLFASDALPPRLVWSKQHAQVVQTDINDPIQQKYELE
ncbi:hypothetical protein Poli38472_013603 [Pythium oligandrum]|uniref:ACT domain-containing protein n=1 Tax=Pythium oligandrum TaxID=41045 RepID=A0A8K1FF11_PYTOL|nr:hypothetical protein Poli38472_013603 [Pythium oligandrum]|eukprot:TMW61140.1 hypothetical protein Poli38472_013603 [Pythium oligandrum]